MSSLTNFCCCNLMRGHLAWQPLSTGCFLICEQMLHLWGHKQPCRADNRKVSALSAPAVSPATHQHRFDVN